MINSRIRRAMFSRSEFEITYLSYVVFSRFHSPHFRIKFQFIKEIKAGCNLYSRNILYPRIHIVLNYYKCGYQTVCGSFRSLFLLLVPSQLLTFIHLFRVIVIYKVKLSIAQPSFKNILSQISNYFPSNFAKT